MPSFLARILRQAGKPFYPLYYRLLWGRKLPGAAAAERLVGRWEGVSGRGDVPVAAPTWDAQYRGGDWRFLHGPDEAARYGVLLAWLERFAPGGSVLDLGCGDGLLQRMLAPRGHRYTGVDLSAAAIEAARESVGAAGGEARFLVADAENYEPADPHDAVVCNECLYYFRDPLGTAERYWRRGRAPGGILLASLFSTPRSAAIARRLPRRLPLAAELELRHRKGRWLLQVYAEGAG